MCVLCACTLPPLEQYLQESKTAFNHGHPFTVNNINTPIRSGLNAPKYCAAAVCSEQLRSTVYLVYLKTNEEYMQRISKPKTLTVARFWPAQKRGNTPTNPSKTPATNHGMFGAILITP